MGGSTLDSAPSGSGGPQTCFGQKTLDLIYGCKFWANKCKNLDLEEICTKRATDVGFAGGLTRDGTPTSFICLLCRIVELQPSLGDVEILLDFKNAITNTRNRYVRLLIAFYVKLIAPIGKANAYLEPLQLSKTSMIVLTSDEKYTMTTLGKCICDLQSGMECFGVLFNQIPACRRLETGTEIALSLPPSNDLIRRISASVDDAAATNHHQNEATAAITYVPSVRPPRDEPQTLLQSLLLENERIHQHSGDSKALSVKDTEEHTLPNNMDNRSKFDNDKMKLSPRVSCDLDLMEIDAFLSDLDRKYEYNGEELPWKSMSISVPHSLSPHNESLVTVTNDHCGDGGVSPPRSVESVPTPKKFSQQPDNDAWHVNLRNQEEASCLSDGRIKLKNSSSRCSNGIGGGDIKSNPNPDPATRLESTPPRQYCKNRNRQINCVYEHALSKSPSRSPSVCRGPGAQMKDGLKMKKLKSKGGLLGLKRRLKSGLKGKGGGGVNRPNRMDATHLTNGRQPRQNPTSKHQRRKRPKMNAFCDAPGPDYNQTPSTPEKLGGRLPPFSDRNYWDIERSNLGIRPASKDASVSIPITDPVTGQGFDPPDTPLEETLYWARAQENPKERSRLLNQWKERQKQKGAYILDDTLDIDEVEMEDVSYGEKLTVINNSKYGGGGGGGVGTTTAACKVFIGGDRIPSTTTINRLENGGNDKILQNTWWGQQEKKKYAVDEDMILNHQPEDREEEDMLMDDDDNEFVENEDDDEVEVVVRYLD